MKEVEQIIKVIYQLKWSQDPKASVHDSKLIYFFLEQSRYFFPLY